MKKIAFLFATMLTITGLAQNSAGSGAPAPTGGNTTSSVFGSSGNSVGLFDNEVSQNINTNIDVNKLEGIGILEFDNLRLSKGNIDGSFYLYDQWENRGVIEVEDKRYVLSNMNYDVRKGTFMSQINQDSLVTFDITTFDRVLINDRPFKSIYNPSKRANETFEIIFEGPDFSILKGYAIEITEANPNPMINRSKRRVLKKSSYFVKKRNSIKRFKMKKKNLLALAGDKKGQLENYAKANRLSFKKDNDVRRMMVNVLSGTSK